MLLFDSFDCTFHPFRVISVLYNFFSLSSISDLLGVACILCDLMFVWFCCLVSLNFLFSLFSAVQSKTGGGISGALLVMWCVGDLMNLVVIARAASRFIVNVEFPQGALIKQPGLSQLGLSFFFLGSDLVLFLQQ